MPVYSLYRIDQRVIRNAPYVGNTPHRDIGLWIATTREYNGWNAYDGATVQTAAILLVNTSSAEILAHCQRIGESNPRLGLFPRVLPLKEAKMMNIRRAIMLGDTPNDHYSADYVIRLAADHICKDGFFIREAALPAAAECARAAANALKPYAARLFGLRFLTSPQLRELLRLYPDLDL